MSDTYCIFEAQVPLARTLSKQKLDQHLLAAPHQEILTEIAENFQGGINNPNTGHVFCAKEQLFFDSKEILEEADHDLNCFYEDMLDFTVDENNVIWNVWIENTECTIPKYASWLINKEFGANANVLVEERYMSLYDCSKNYYSVKPSTKIIWC